MKKFLLLFLGITLILAVTAPIVAQESGSGNRIFTTPIRIDYPIGRSSTPSGYTPLQMRAAYKFNSIPNQGQGMTIGIVDACDYPTAEADLGVFSTQFGLPACTIANGCLTVIPQSGSLCSGHSGNWALEQALDVQWAHAMAPAAKIVLVQASQASDVLFNAVDLAVTAGSNVVSMSWGYGGGFSGEQAYDFHFQVPGVTFFSSTGDSGCLTNYPAESPYVVAVGGTALSLGVGGTAVAGPLGSNYGSEVAWSGSGGGISLYEAEPSWQMGVQHSGFRSIPDVALDAAPSTGVPIYDSYDGYQWIKIGGTSLSSPVWAAFMAIENSLRGGVGHTIQQFLPDLYQTVYPSGNYGLNFHDITTGSSGGICVAGTGYDYVTGVGTPIANHLANDLLPLP